MFEKFVALYQSPIGNIEIVSDKDRIFECNFRENVFQSSTIPPVLKQALTQLDEYFKGKRKEFDLPLSTSGTNFQEEVWNELMNIPFGQTISYSELAIRIGNESAVRAVGNANGQNPISIIIPCHRVIGADGNLVGYGGGIERKKWLIEFEKS